MTLTTGIAATGRSAVRKVHRRLVPYLLLLYALAFLDRVNIGYAEKAMAKDIPGFGALYGLLAGIFFVGYVLLEVPSNLMLRRFGARRWLSRIMISWGVVAALTAVCSTVTGIGAVRLLLGAMEAGFFPGVALYLMSWLPRREMARAFAVFISAQVISMIFGGPVSGVILDHAQWLGVDSWRWLFVLEGLPAVLLGVLTLRLLPDGPAKARWLDADEKRWLTETIEREQRERREQRPSALGTWSVLRDPRAITLAVIDFLLVLGAFGLTFYLPSIVQAIGKGMSYTQSSLLSAIPFIVGGVFMYLNGWHSDRSGERPLHVAAAAVVGAIGFVLLAHTDNAVLVMVALSLAAIGAYGYISAYWALPASVLSDSAAPVGLAAVNSVGSSGGFVGPYLVGLLSVGTGTQLGGVSPHALYALAASFLLAAVLLTGFRLAGRRGPARTEP